MCSMSKNEKICSWAEEIPALLLGELDAERTAEIERHIAGCPACTAQREQFSRMLFRLRAPMAEQPVRDLAPEILARLPAAKAAWHRRSFWFRAAALLLATLGLGTALVWNNHHFFRSGRPVAGGRQRARVAGADAGS
jgi:anti-sigma factor RsiW